ncbi:hypothetical protein KTQ42_15630|uniref:DNA primase family protein n=1 Tax=Noviherbaspirillum sp. L7-7A TaxID=2850560 RepID=UPI001C2C6AE4|nr:phage/plasmid primase, P4 family [Noviherbaspirillum sp. L7-7A]MBV0880732.1 hypothetical protein [Noviherbaspirillum sp. L7-7A]
MITALNNDTIDFCFFDHVKDNQPQPQSVPVPEFLEFFQTHDIREEKDGLAFSPVRYKPGSLRCSSAVLELTLAVLDVDGGNKDAVVQKCTDLGWPCIIVSSFSNTRDKECFRVIVFPSRPIQPHEWPKLWGGMCHVLNTEADSNARDVGRVYYAPSCPKSREADSFVVTLEGTAPMDVDALLALDFAPRRAGRKKGSDGERLTYRQMAEQALQDLFSGPIWFYHENFWLYQNGYWRIIDLKIDVKKRVLMKFPELSATGANEVAETAKLLAAEHESQDPDEGGSAVKSTSRWICLLNGTLDPVTGVLHKHAMFPRILSGLNIEWSPAAEAPRTMQFFYEAWGQEPDYQERVEFFQEFLGYLLYPSNKFETFLWCTGSGANGKSVALGMMADLVGQRNTSYAHLERLNRPAVRATLEGKMLNISTEMSAEATLADGYLKSITSGEAVETEPKYKDSYSFVPTVKLVAATNHLPRLKDTSGGFARRAVILSFNRTFGPEERDPDLSQKLRAELPGILAFAVRGLQRLLKRGRFVPPPSSVTTVETYRTESDSVSLFNEECLTPCETGTPVGDLYAAYREFCARGGFHPTNAAVFGRRLTELGVGKLGKSCGKPIRAAKHRTDADDPDGTGETPLNLAASAKPRSGRTKISIEEAFASFDETAGNEEHRQEAA